MRYQVGGSLHSDDPSYVVRQADERLYASLKAGEFCYVLNSRQMGKSSLLQRTSYRLRKEGYSCAYLDVTRLGSENTTPEQWYKGIIVSLFYDLNLAEHLNFKHWWDTQAGISPVQKLHSFVEGVLLPNVQSEFLRDGKAERIFIFIDEIDSLLSLSFPVSDFFAWIRHCYNQQAHDPNFQRLGFALFGVASPSDLIADKRRTPFNIGTAIELYGFQLHQATPLLKGLEEVVSQPEIVLREIIYSSGGQPFLTQKLCQLIVRTALETSSRKIVLPPATEAFWVEQLVLQHIIQHWEAKDEPEHLRTIRDRLLFNEQRAGRLLGVYQQVLQALETDTQTSGVPTDDSREQTELLLSGLVEKHNGYLKIKNPIYRSVFNSEWVLRQLDNLRPYSQAFNAWVASGYQDESRLLRGQALQEVLEWSGRKSLSDLDYRFLAASQELEHRETEQRLKAERLRETEARLAIERKSARRQRRLLAVVSLALIISTVLGVMTLVAYRESALSEVRITAVASNANFASNQHLDALVQAIQARTKFQRLWLLDPSTKSVLDQQTRKVLEEAVYGADEVNSILAHQGGALGVDFSADGQWIASGGTDRIVRLWKRDGTLVHTLPHNASLYGVQFSPDSQRVAAAGLDGVVRLWSVDGTPLATMKGHTAPVWGVAFSPDGQIIASTSADRTINLWRTNGTLIKTLEGHKADVWSVAFSPDGKILASSSVDKTIKLWSPDGTVIRTLQVGSGPVWGVAFSPDGQILVSGCEDNYVKLWNRSGELLRTLEGHTAGVQKVAFSSDGQTIASTGNDKTVKLWRRDGSLLRTFRGHRTVIRSVAISPVRVMRSDSDQEASALVGQIIASAGEDGIIKLWKSSPFQHLLNNHQNVVWRVAYAPNTPLDQSLLATVAGQAIKLWRRDGSLIKTIPINTSQVNTVAFSTVPRAAFKKNQETLAIGTINGNIQLLNLSNDETTILRGHNAGIFGLAYSPDGEFLVSVADDLTLRLWQRDASGQFQLCQTIQAHSSRIWDLAFSSDGQFIASASVDGTVKLWTWKNANHQALQLYKTLKGHKSAVWGVAISPSSQHIVSAGRDGQLLLWNRDGKLMQSFKEGNIGLTRVAFSPDGQKIAAASWDNTIKIWALDGTLLKTLSGHLSTVMSVAFSPDGKTLASGSDDQTAILWDLQQILHIDPLAYGCDWVRDYLKTNKQVEKGVSGSLTQGDRFICN
ncbi:AAA-like domain-containing protein [Scytonema sp. PCC 10023]|uniref:WD40 domain-containing protein n=1 Tax=Scytonema sp. PCC 10023 TaxID=1680591 RepID=UPI0039C73B05